jgi:hypothetical protein
MILNSAHMMESEYFETSWKTKIVQVRRWLRTLFQSAVDRYYKPKKKGYTRFLTEEEQRCGMIF